MHETFHRERNGRALSILVYSRVAPPEHWTHPGIIGCVPAKHFMGRK